MLIQCRYRIEGEGSTSPWTRASIGLGQKNNTVYLVITSSLSQHKFEVTNIEKIHPATIVLRKPPRKILIGDCDKHKLDLLLSRCRILRRGQNPRVKVPHIDDVVVKPKTTFFRGKGDNYGNNLMNPLLERVYLESAKKIPSALWSLHNLTELELKDFSLTNIPPQLGETCLGLKKLCLSHNKIQSITPSAIKKLNELVSLDLSHNNLLFLPPQINYLKNLVSLNVHNNQIFRVPLTFAGLRNLRDLKISNNCIDAFNIVFLRTFTKNVKLINLDLSGNPLMGLDDESNSNSVIKFPSLFTLTASAVVKNPKLVKSLHQFVSTDIEDILYLLSDTCIKCKRQFLRSQKFLVKYEHFHLNALAADVITSYGASSFNRNVAYSIHCYYCTRNSPEFALLYSM